MSSKCTELLCQHCNIKFRLLLLFQSEQDKEKKKMNNKYMNLDVLVIQNQFINKWFCCWIRCNSLQLHDDWLYYLIYWLLTIFTKFLMKIPKTEKGSLLNVLNCLISSLSQNIYLCQNWENKNTIFLNRIYFSRRKMWLCCWLKAVMPKKKTIHIYLLFVMP